MKPKKPPKRAPKPKVYSVTFKVRTTAGRNRVLSLVYTAVNWVCLDDAVRLVMTPRVEEVGTR